VGPSHGSMGGPHGGGCGVTWTGEDVHLEGCAVRAFGFCGGAQHHGHLPRFGAWLEALCGCACSWLGGGAGRGCAR
jgi:hypothetical protein